DALRFEASVEKKDGHESIMPQTRPGSERAGCRLCYAASSRLSARAAFTLSCTVCNNVGMASYLSLAQRVLSGAPATVSDAQAILASRNEDLLDLVAAAGRLRREHFGNLVKVNYLVNLKSGLCPEDCSYCSQRLGSEAEILKYSWLPRDEAKRQAEFGLAGGASRVCLVASGRGPSNRD